MTTSDPMTKRVEEVVDEFTKWASTPATPDEEFRPFTEMTADWLRTTLTQLIKEVREEERERIAKSIHAIPASKHIEGAPSPKLLRYDHVIKAVTPNHDEKRTQ